MKKIGGNITATVQQKTSSKNAIGEPITLWKDLKTIKGFLDYSTGESSTAIYNAKLEDTTHIFFCDYVELPEENQIRMVINSKVYEVKLIDNPMGWGEHLEIYLRYVGT
jgi:head-tail adaptor